MPTVKRRKKRTKMTLEQEIAMGAEVARLGKLHFTLELQHKLMKQAFADGKIRGGRLTWPRLVVNTFKGTRYEIWLSRCRKRFEESQRKQLPRRSSSGDRT